MKYYIIILSTTKTLTLSYGFLLDKCKVELWEVGWDDSNSYYSVKTDAEHGMTYQVNSFGNGKTWGKVIAAMRITGKNCIVELESELGGVICTVRHGSYNSADFITAGCQNHDTTDLGHTSRYTVLGIPLSLIR